jgi:hypothetical protein
MFKKLFRKINYLRLKSESDVCAKEMEEIPKSTTQIIPRLKQVDNVEDEMPTNFQIEIIDSLSKYSDKELDKAIKG